MDLINIKNDLYDIDKRVKEIDDYTLKFNRKLSRYEIHSKYGLELSLGEETPTGECLYKLQRTRLANKKKLIAEIENHNLMVEKKQRKNFISQMEQIYGS